MLEAYELRCEYSSNPIAVGTKAPRFSWKCRGEGVSLFQAAYRLQVAEADSFKDPLWDSGVVVGSESLFLPYAGPALKPITRYSWRVMVVDRLGEEGPWSESALFETARLGEAWDAPFIGGVPSGAVPGDQAAASGRPRYLRHEFTLHSAPSSARAYVTALGLYELRINGAPVTDALFTPGWTSYRKRLAYQTYDVSSLLKPGKNAVAAILADGWYSGDLTWLEGVRELFGSQLGLSMELRATMADGPEQVVATGKDWKCSFGPLSYAQLYHGETYDARLERDGWDGPDFDDSAWSSVTEVPFDSSVVVPQDGPLVKIQERLKPISLITTPKGERVLDFGQNLTGWVSFTVRGAAGDRVVLKHAEILDPAGNFYLDNMRGARNTIDYTLKGSPLNGGVPESYSPRFSFQGFRYALLESWPGQVSLDDFEAQVIHSDMEATMDFQCSDEDLNQLHHNILWGWKGNSLDVPTDCPQRDERLGWTGDAQVFVGTAAYLMDVNGFFRKWLRDLSADQTPEGGVPFVIPDVLTDLADREPTFKDSHSSTGWGDVATVAPWTCYCRYADKALLAEQYPSMKAWLEYIRSKASGGLVWDSGFHFGDWVALDAKEGSYFGATPNDLTATAFYAYSSDLVSKAAAALGKAGEAAAYRELHDNIVSAFQNEFVTPSGRLAAHTQTAHILALVFGLLPTEHRPRAVRDLASLLEENGGHLTTGFLGTPFLCRALAENGRLDLAYELLMKKDYPSWLYQITRGATTVWEHWDGLKPDDSLWDPHMNSFNHYAYGAVGQWIYETLCGLSPREDGPGFHSFTLAPQPGGGVDRCRFSYRSPYGTISSSWKVEGRRFSMDFTIPANTEATVLLRGVDAGRVSCHLLGSAELRAIPFSDVAGNAQARLGSGSYTLGKD